MLVLITHNIAEGGRKVGKALLRQRRIAPGKNEQPSSSLHEILGREINPLTTWFPTVIDAVLARYLTPPVTSISFKVPGVRKANLPCQITYSEGGELVVSQEFDCDLRNLKKLGYQVLFFLYFL
ncbi:hypothetical protein KQX54_019765 [Cotesia glomerata]|uniref:Uncharacterized protein n=1 Tax=Cotesia glomerata TaxID=32391 RepID=A0AAV7IYA1_COTGL|nr:hypothetical protein KQX54_019765 [Cotesia glomerata]